MVSKTIQLTTVNGIRSFVKIISKYNFEARLISGKYKVNAKSIMGIFSLDLSKFITLEVQSDDCEQFLNEINHFIVA
jgi:phosphotransferase system HPr-like phosphotransfer protein